MSQFNYDGLNANLKVLQFFPNGNKAEMQFASEMISQSSVIIMDAQICGTDFTDPQFLLLVTGGWHRIPIVDFGSDLFLLDVFDLLHHLHWLFNISIRAKFLCWGQLFPDFFCQIMNLLQLMKETLIKMREWEGVTNLGCHFGTQFFLSFHQTFLGQLCLSVSLVDERR